MEVIKFEKVKFSYEKQEQNDPFDQSSVKDSFCLDGLDLSIHEGEFVAVLGHNGSGKSTLARLVNGLLTPSAGEITVLGKKATEENLFEIRKQVGIVFQNPDNQMVASIVEDDICFGPENIGLSREEIGKRIDFALKATKTEELRNSTASRLSGGQKQRVAIAGVLALKPQILILDESTSMLDPKAREEVMSVVKELIKSENMTVIVITHYMDEVTECDRVVVLDSGKKVAEGTPTEIFNRPDIIYGAGLDLPIPLKICEKLKSLGIDVGDVLEKEELGEKLCELLQRT